MTARVTYGEGIPGEEELHLLGDVSAGRRVLELGLAGNAVPLALAGAKALAVDPDADLIADLRLEAAKEGVSVECHQGELADLGFAPSGTIDAVIAAHTLHEEDDLGRTLRQVHRVLKTGAPFIMALDHPFAAVGVGPPAPRGDTGTTTARWATSSSPSTGPTSGSRRSTSSASSDEHPIPTTLVVKARKQGS